MKLRFLLGIGIGYVLGARAGRARYEAIVRLARTVAGNETVQTTVQTTAGAAQAQADALGKRVRHAIGHLLTHDDPTPGPYVAPSVRVYDDNGTQTGS